MGGSQSRPLLNLRAENTAKTLEAVLVGGNQVRIFDTSSKPRQVNLLPTIVESESVKGGLGGEDNSFTAGTAFSSDSKFYAGFNTLEHAINIYEMKSGALAKSIKTEKLGIEFARQVLFTKDNKYVLLCNDGVTDVTPGQKEVFIFEVESGELKGKLSGHTAFISAMAISPCGKFLATGSRDSNVIIWDISSSSSLLSSKMIGAPKKGQKCTETTPVTSIAFSGDSKYVYAVHDDQEQCLLKPKVFGYTVADPDHKQVCALGGQDDNDDEKDKVYSLCTSGCGKMIVGFTEEKFVRVFLIDEQTGALKKKYDMGGFSDNTMEGSCSPDNKLALICRDNTLYVCDLNDDCRKILSKGGVYEHGYHQYCPVFSPDGNFLANPNQRSGDLRVHNVVMGEEQGEPRKTKSEKVVYQSIAFNEDGTKVTVTGGEKGEEKETLDV